MKLKRASIFTKIVIMALVLYAGLSLMSTKSKVNQANAERDEIAEQVEAIIQSNAEKEYEINHSGDDDTIEHIARTRLGLVGPGEKIFYDVSK